MLIILHDNILQYLKICITTEIRYLQKTYPSVIFGTTYEKMLIEINRENIIGKICPFTNDPLNYIKVVHDRE